MKLKLNEVKTLIINSHVVGKVINEMSMPPAEEVNKTSKMN